MLLFCAGCCADYSVAIVALFSCNCGMACCSLVISDCCGCICMITEQFVPSVYVILIVEAVFFKCPLSCNERNVYLAQGQILIFIACIFRHMKSDGCYAFANHNTVLAKLSAVISCTCGEHLTAGEYSAVQILSQCTHTPPLGGISKISSTCSGALTEAHVNFDLISKVFVVCAEHFGAVFSKNSHLISQSKVTFVFNLEGFNLCVTGFPKIVVEHFVIGVFR